MLIFLVPFAPPSRVLVAHSVLPRSCHFELGIFPKRNDAPIFVMLYRPTHGIYILNMRSLPTERRPPHFSLPTLAQHALPSSGITRTWRHWTPPFGYGQARRKKTRSTELRHGSARYTRGCNRFPFFNFYLFLLYVTHCTSLSFGCHLVAICFLLLLLYLN